MVQLNVGAVRSLIIKQTRLAVRHLPTTEDESHSGIFGYGDVNKNRLISGAIGNLFAKRGEGQNIYPAIPE